MRIETSSLKTDVIAGITVGLILIPQSLAYAQLAGLPAYYGLYASLLPPLVASFLGSSRHLSTGPVAVLSLMTQTALSPLATAGSNEYIVYATLLALSLGIFQFLLGVLKLGELVNFLSHPVIYGFTNAAAIIIATTQLSSFFGIATLTYEHYYQTILFTLRSVITDTHLPTLSLGIFALALMITLRKLAPKLPGTLIVILITALFSWFLGLKVSLVGEIPTGLPKFGIPQINFSVISHLFLAIITMSIIGFTEAVSVAQAIAVKTKQRLDPDRELIGQGLANVTSSLSGSYPVSGSFSRSAVNYQVGAKTWVSSLSTSAIVLITLLFLTPLLFFIPKVTLAAIIMLAVGGLIDLSKLKYIWLTNKADATAAILTFSGTLYFSPDLEKGVVLGVVFSIGHFVYRTTHPRIAFLSKYKDEFYHDASTYHMDRCKNIAVVRLDAPLFFANSSYFENVIIRYLSENSNITDILIVASGINEIDSTGEEMLRRFIEDLRIAKKDLYFSTLKKPVAEVFKKSGLRKKIGKDHFFATTKEAVEFLLKHVAKSHQHDDERDCPLNKYIYVSEKHLKSQRHERDKIAFYYQKLFSRFNGRR